LRSDCDGRTAGLAEVHSSAIVGPDVTFGPGTKVGPFCRFEGRVQVGEDCRFRTGVVVGTAPMDRNYLGEDTGVIIGNGNEFHEYTTIHRSTGKGTNTVIGDNNYIMAYVHIAHNCRIGNSCTVTNGTQLGGYVEVGNGANLGGMVGVHQFCRIGKLAMVGACSYVNKDIPPFLMAQGQPCRVRGINAVGMKRAGFSDVIINTLKQAFGIIYRSGLNLGQALEQIESGFLSTVKSGKSREEVQTLIGFIKSSKRGIELRTGSS